MKKSIPIIIVFFLLTSCDWTAGTFTKASLDKSEIDSIILIPRFPDDTIALPSINLTDKNIRKFTDEWNEAKSSGPCKFYVNYHLTVYLKDNKQRDFRCNGKNIKENKDECYEIGDHNYFDNLYKNN